MNWTCSLLSARHGFLTERGAVSEWEQLAIRFAKASYYCRIAETPATRPTKSRSCKEPHLRVGPLMRDDLTRNDSTRSALEHSSRTAISANSGHFGGGFGPVLANELHCLGAKMNWPIIEISFPEPVEALSDDCLERTPKACGFA
jgi:hypothetical protein